MKSVTLSLVLFTSLATLNGQSFRNLDFETAHPPYNFVPGEFPTGHVVLVSEALPSWSVWYSSERKDTMMYNVMSLGGSAVSLSDKDFECQQQLPLINGNNTLVMFGGRGGLFGEPMDVAITQEGTIPGNAQSLRYFAYNGLAPLFSLSFNGVDLPAQQLEQQPAGYWLYAANVSGVAGQTGELRLTTHSPGPSGFIQVTIDDLQFSTSPVPEPSSVALFLLGSGLLFWHRRAKRRGSQTA